MRTAIYKCREKDKYVIVDVQGRAWRLVAELNCSLEDIIKLAETAGLQISEEYFESVAAA